MIRTLIICFDGLDRKPVEEYDLVNVKQVDYGDIRGGGTFSGLLWSSFLTGRSPEEHKIKSWKDEALSTPNYFEDKFPTIVSLFKRPQVLYFPFVDPRWKIYLGVEHSLPKIYEVNAKVFEEVLKVSKGDWDLLLTCFMLIDNLGHKGMLNRSAYYLIDEWVKIIKEKSRPEWTLIIGDKSPRHTLPGFYSSSIVLERKPETIEDFYSIIKERLQNVSKSNTRSI